MKTILLSLLLASVAQAEALKLIWNPNPSIEQVEGYRVQYGPNQDFSTYTEVSTNWPLVWSKPSVVGKYTPNRPMFITGNQNDTVFRFVIEHDSCRTVEVQMSPDLANWTSQDIVIGPFDSYILEYPKQDVSRMFFRARIKP